METSSDWDQCFSRMKINEYIHEYAVMYPPDIQHRLQPQRDLGLMHSQENGWIDTDMFLFIYF